MSGKIGKLCWPLILLAAGSADGPSLTENSSHFPRIASFLQGDQTHDNPSISDIVATFDSHPVRLEVMPLEATNPVQGERLLVVTVFDEKGQPCRNCKVEWALEGIGQIVEVAESGLLSGKGYKATDTFAVSHTSYSEHKLQAAEKGKEPVTLQPGQSWCKIRSGVEGDAQVTVRIPDIASRENSSLVVRQHWVDAEWVLPRPVVSRAGTEQVLTANVFRSTDHQPLANCRVRFRVVDGSPALFLPSRSPDAVVASDAKGEARVALAQVSPVLATNKIAVELLCPGNPGTIIGRGEVTAQWQAPAVKLDQALPPAVAVGQEMAYTLTVKNVGSVETHGVTVQQEIPEGVQYVRSDPPAAQQGNLLIWRLPELHGLESKPLKVVFQPKQVGTLACRANVVTDDGLKDEKSCQTKTTAPQVKVTQRNPGACYVGAPVASEITVSNPGDGTATHVKLTVKLAEGLDHASHNNPVQMEVGSLAPGESRTMTLTLIPRRKGPLTNLVTVTADGSLHDQCEQAFTALEARLEVKASGPTTRFVGRLAEWDVLVANAGETPLENVQLQMTLPPQLIYSSASAGGRVAALPGGGGQATWNLGALEPGAKKTIQLAASCAQVAHNVVLRARVTNPAGLSSEAVAPLEIRGLPALRLEVSDLRDPVEVGGTTGYKLQVTNQGTLVDNHVQVIAEVPAGMRILGARGPVGGRIEGQRVIFPAMDNLRPGQSLVYQVDIKAEQAGDMRFRADLTSVTLKEPIRVEESTNVYQPR